MLCAHMLKDLGDRIGLVLPSKKNEMIKTILSDVEFEPYVGMIDRPCKRCNRTTEQEIHFTPDWELNYYQCIECNNKDSAIVGDQGIKVQMAPVDKSSDISKKNKDTDLHQGPEIIRGSSHWKIEYGIGLFSLYFAILSLFSVSYLGLVEGVVAAIILSIFITLGSLWALSRFFFKEI